MLFKYNKFHEAAFMGVAGEVTGRISERYNNIEYYLRLKKVNETLVQENAKLRNMLRQDFQAPDSSQKFVVDSFRIDSLEKFRRYLYLPAKVINNSAMTSEQTSGLILAELRNRLGLK